MNALNEIAAIGIFSGTKTASHDHFAILSKRLANSGKTFFYR